MEHLTVRILDRDYRLSCEPGEREMLLAAVEHVDASMRTIRDQGKIIGTERIAVFAALNIAGALLSKTATDEAGSSRTSSGSVAVADRTDATEVGTAATQAVADPEILRRMQAINALLDTALASQERLF